MADGDQPAPTAPLRTQSQGVRNFLLAVIALGAAGFVLVHARSVILPFLVAFFCMVLLSPLVHWMRSKKVPTLVAVPASLLLVALGFLGLGLAFYANLGPIMKAVPKYRERGKVLYERGAKKLESMGLKDDLEDLVGPGGSKLDEIVDPGSLVSFLTGGVTSFMSFLGQCVLVLLILTFMLFEATRFQEKTERAFGRDSPIFDTMECISRDLQVYIKYKTLVSLATGVGTTLCCAIFGVDFPLFWGILAFGLNYIPNIGSFVASALPPMLALFQFDTIWPAVGLLVALLVVQNVLGSVVEPKLMGDSLSVSPLLLLLSLVFWGFLWGVVGMILAVPMAVTLKIVCQHVDRLKPVGVMFEA